MVFNTAMSGYQEVLTDPSYKGQLVCMTYPEIGNVGVNEEDAESARIFVEGFIVKDYWPRPSNWRAQMPLGDYLRDAGVVGIEGIDTRALVRHIRTCGAQEAVISSVDLDPESLVRKAKASPGLVGRDLVKEVTCAVAYDWDRANGNWAPAISRPQIDGAPLVVAMDYGIKRNILRSLISHGFRVKVLPATATAADILACNPDGVFLSNGPADPAALPYASEAVRGVLGKKPVFGICLGHQILGLAIGGKTYKLGVRPSRRQSSGQGPEQRARGDNFTEPRLRRRCGLGCRTRRDLPSQSQRPDRGRDCAGRASRSSPCSTIRRPRPDRMTRAICSSVSGGWSKPFRATARRRSIACLQLKTRWTESRLV